MAGGPASGCGTSGDGVTRRIDVGYPDDRDRAEERLDKLEGGSDTETDPESVETDDAAINS